MNLTGDSAIRNPDVGVVVIGRNEGDRLRKCLESVIGRAEMVVYVDSGSSDSSVELARSLGAEVVELDASAPFTAARGRNEGFARLNRASRPPRFVQFVDGDCEFVEGWLDEARRALEARPDVAITCGRRRERFPEASVYNRLADLEWDRPAGEAESCGGDSMVRAEAMTSVGGFDPSVAAGEEPELCFRLRRAGWKVLRLGGEMTLHDMAMTRFGQWWRRRVRGGRGALDVALRCGGPSAPFVRQVRSARVWTIGWLAALALASGLAWSLLGPGIGLGVALTMALLPAVQALRIAMSIRQRLGDFRLSLAFGALSMVGKWAELAGQIAYYRDRLAGRRVRLIEYKGDPQPAVPLPPRSASS